ncbi:MoxR family ATPase [Salinirubellus salinus]|uniref:MoxR family ATPase n=1 Tax=Salinirubellus salinus TaxID=1364945 RepID=A0A9E7UB23_9EURY|nr:MoxR family ATPase [Salinirubellus salinus]UWM54394.1 MoxR family ATPase [Salinirubellus salinus]
MEEAKAVYEALREEMESVLVGRPDVVELLTVALLVQGHVLIEGLPGVGKTTAAKLLAQASDLDVRRIQYTPDHRPADITGTYVYREGTGEFELRRGPVFANVVIADEINRGSPQTQSALLEAMEEQQVTLEGETLPVPTPFMVVATQNPIETSGTFDLPVAQRDRFEFQLEMGVPGRDIERALLDRLGERHQFEPGTVEKVVTAADIAKASEAVREVHVEPSVKEYIVDLVEESRAHPQVTYGASPRALFAFFNGARALAAIDGRDFVTPDDVLALAHAVLVHRLVLAPEVNMSDLSAADIVEDVVDTVEPPGSDFDLEGSAMDRWFGDGTSAGD